MLLLREVFVVLEIKPEVSHVLSKSLLPELPSHPPPLLSSSHHHHHHCHLDHWGGAQGLGHARKVLCQRGISPAPPHKVLYAFCKSLHLNEVEIEAQRGEVTFLSQPVSHSDQIVIAMIDYIGLGAVNSVCKTLLQSECFAGTVLFDPYDQQTKTQVHGWGPEV